MFARWHSRFFTRKTCRMLWFSSKLEQFRPIFGHGGISIILHVHMCICADRNVGSWGRARAPRDLSARGQPGATKPIYMPIRILAIFWFFRNGETISPELCLPGGLGIQSIKGTKYNPPYIYILYNYRWLNIIIYD